MPAVKKLKAKPAHSKAAKKAPSKGSAKTGAKAAAAKTRAKPTVAKTGAKSGKKATPSKKAQAKPKAVAPKAAAPKSVSARAKPKARPNGDLMSFKNFEPYPLRKGEEYMNETQIAHFRHILGSWKKELMEEVDRTMHYMQDEAANFPDPNDRASQESDFTLELRARDRERKLIKKIDEALQRLDNHEYGECESCGVEIGIRRLEARPTATLCIDCKTLDEIREKQMGD